MIAALIELARRVGRALPPSTWLMMGGVLAAVVAAAWIYSAGRGDEREAQGERTAKGEAKAAVGREVAAGERAIDATNNTNRLEEWNHEAEQTPDSLPSARDRRRRCRQLRDAGVDVAECRGPEA